MGREARSTGCDDLKTLMGILLIMLRLFDSLARISLYLVELEIWDRSVSKP